MPAAFDRRGGRKELMSTLFGGSCGAGNGRAAEPELRAPRKAGKQAKLLPADTVTRALPFRRRLRLLKCGGRAGNQPIPPFVSSVFTEHPGWAPHASMRITGQQEKVDNIIGRA